VRKNVDLWRNLVDLWRTYVGLWRTYVGLWRIKLHLMRAMSRRQEHAGIVLAGWEQPIEISSSQ
jgi:hypothetical protein